MTVDNRDGPEFRTPDQNSAGRTQQGFADPTGSYPRIDYFFEPTTNRAARSRTRNSLFTGGGLDGLSVELPLQIETLYPNSQVYETPSGHVLEFDDTPGGQRILIRHNTGSGIELRADGSMLMRTEANMVTTVAGEAGLIIEGDAEVSCNANLSLRVAGDFNLDVGGNINILSGGNKIETINGNSREAVYGTRSSQVRGSRNDTTIGVVARTNLGGLNEITQGAMNTTVDGDARMSTSGGMTQTASGAMSMASPNVNMAGGSISVFGGSGTIGGSGVVMYSQTSYAATFHGDLNGTAKEALLADETNFQNFPAGSVGAKTGMAYTNDGTATAQPTPDILSDYLGQSAGGAVNVQVDAGGILRNTVDRTVENEGISPRPMNTREVRSALREPNNRRNDTYTGNMVANGVLSPNFATPVPGGIGRIDDATGTPRFPSESPTSTPVSRPDRFTPDRNVDVDEFVPDPIYDVNNIPEDQPINADTPLADGIRMARFLGGTGDRVTLSHIPSREEKLAIARQFMMQAAAVNTIIRSRGEFANQRLIVVEGLYLQGEGETLTDESINERATTGEVVVYELHNEAGQIAAENTFDLAVYWKDTLLFDQLILDYDTYDPSGELNVQIILVMPEIDENYKIVNGRYRNEVATYFNGELQGNELIEITEDGVAASGAGVTADLDERIESLDVSDERKDEIRQFIEDNPGVDWVPVQRDDGSVIMVSNDYLRDADGNYIRGSVDSARSIAASNGARIPTVAEVEAIERNASVNRRLITSGEFAGGAVPGTAPRDELIRLSNEAIAGQRIAPQRGDIVSGTLKTIVSDTRDGRSGGIYGGQNRSGGRIQPLYTLHGSDYVDYSQGIRLVAPRTF